MSFIKSFISTLGFLMAILVSLGIFIALFYILFAWILTPLFSFLFRMIGVWSFWICDLSYMSLDRCSDFNVWKILLSVFVLIVIFSFIITLGEKYHNQPKKKRSKSK